MQKPLERHVLQPKAWEVLHQTGGGKPPAGWIPSEEISVAEAVHAYNLGSAYA